jgi:CubicO group peptidase (beta-lactamase class C family)
LRIFTQQCLFVFILALAGLHTLQAQDHVKAVTTLMHKENIPGLSLVYIKGGKLQEQYALGVLSTATHAAVNDSTVFSAASLSKSIFTWVVFHLVETHQLDLDLPLFNYYAYKDVEGDERYKLVTARMILTHTSGLPNWRKKGSPLRFKYNPGQQFSYSGEGFVWLSKVVEKITGKETEEYIRETVFKPLGMRHTSYIWQTSFGNNYALPHTNDGKPEEKYFPAGANVAHSLQTTAVDYGTFLAAMLQDEKFMAVLQSDTGAMVAQRLRWKAGLGYEQTNQGPAFWQWGDNDTFKAFMLGYPGKKEGLVYFTNSFHGLKIAKDLLRIFINSNQPCIDWLDAEAAK